MPDVLLAAPGLMVIRVAIAAVWLYEGLWNKLLGRAPRQDDIVASVPRIGPLFGSAFLNILGLVEVALAVWVLSGFAPGLCALTQVALLIGMNIGGLLWARQSIHDPAGMVVKNAAFLVLVWYCGAGPRPLT